MSGIANALAGHLAKGEREKNSFQLCREFQQRAEDGGSPKRAETHFTASAIVVGPLGSALHLHKRLRLWLQPGGHIENGEEPWEAAEREATEETGLDLSHPASGPVLAHVDVHPAGGHLHLDLRYILIGRGEPRPAAGESRAVRWFSWPNAMAVAGDPGLVAALAAGWQWWRHNEAALGH